MADRFEYRALWLALGYAMIALTVWGSLDPAPPRWAFTFGDKLLHGATYAGLTFWFGLLYPGRWRQAALVLAFTALGALLEVVQAYWSIYRHFDVADAAASAAGSGMAWGALRTGVGRVLADLDGWLAHRHSG
jgi:VanZ family protein